MPAGPRPRFTCSFYRSPAGDEPAREWLKSLPAEVRKEIGADLMYVQHFWPTGMPRVGALGDGLYELRSTARSGEYRLFFCVAGSTLVVLHGFQKKTRATPKSELAVATRRQREVERGK